MEMLEKESRSRIVRIDPSKIDENVAERAPYLSSLPYVPACM